MVQAINSRVPSGFDVAQWFPWFRETALSLEADGTDIQYGSFVAGPHNKAFYNSFDRPLEITELKFLAAGVEQETQLTDISDYLSVQIRTSQRPLIDRWIPVRALGNRPLDYVLYRNSCVRTRLPAPYYLQYGANFKMSLRSTNARYLEGTIDIALRGWDPKNKDPYVIGKTVDIPDTADEEVSFVFDNNRDTQMRDLVFEDISFGLVGVDSTQFDDIDSFHGLEVKFAPNTGPRWTNEDAEWLRITGIAGPNKWCDSSGSYFPVVRHVLDRPVILDINDVLTVRGRYYNPTGTPPVSQVYCWGIGRQEGK